MHAEDVLKSVISFLEREIIVVSLKTIILPAYFNSPAGSRKRPSSKILLHQDFLSRSNVVM